MPTTPIYEVICEIVDNIHPIQLRFGLGFGPLNTSIKENALGMDGPAFYSAREAIKTASDRSGHAIAFSVSKLLYNASWNEVGKNFFGFKKYPSEI